MQFLLVAVFGAGVMGVAYVAARLISRNRVYSQSMDRLEEPSDLEIPEGLAGEGTIGSLRRHYLIPIVAGVIVGFGTAHFLGLMTIFCVAFGLIVTVFLTLADESRVTKSVQRLELQLADAIDLMVGSVRAGMGAVDALESARRETKKPLQPLFGELIGRMRLGDDPQVAVRILHDRVPLESYRLFASALSVHWEIGGSLGPTLTGVGRTIRDRVELGRRVKAQATQARVSVIVFVLVTYFLGIVSWQSNPDRMESFLGSEFGSMLAAGAMLMQGLGVFWISRLSRIPY